MGRDLEEHAALSQDEVEDLHGRFKILLETEGSHRTRVELYGSILPRLERTPEPSGLLARIHFMAGHAFVFGNLPGGASEGLTAWRRALALAPRDAMIASNYVSACLNRGFYEDVVPVASWLKDDPNPALARQAHENLIFALSGLTDVGRYEQLLAAVRDWAGRYILPQVPRRKSYRGRQPGRPLRVGFLHSFFDRPPYHGLLIPLFEQMDRSRIATYCYSTGGSNIPERFQRVVTFHDLKGKSEEEIFWAIRSDSLDILVSLDGFHFSSPMNVIARRPAPSVVAWHNTSFTFGGLFDYMIGDGIVVPARDEPLFAEQVMKTSCCYFVMEPLGLKPPRGEAPVLRNGHITFGSMNRPEKFGPDMIQSWRRIMEAVPDSRLVLRYFSYSDPVIRERALADLVGGGIPEARITVLGGCSDYEFSDTYNQVDIALDTFPMNGGTTTYDCLQMGVPTIAWAGEHWASRVGASILSHAGLEDLVADTPEQYEALAISLATDRDKLLAMRARIVDAMENNPQTKTATFAREMTEIFERIADHRASQRA